jgi:hypothetical protein
MHAADFPTVDQIGRHALLGAFVGMVLVGQVLWFDVSAIGSMLKAADNTLLVNLFIGGAMLKGALLGAALGTVRLRSPHELSVKRDAALAVIAARAEAA